jgi:hypothetical protein
MSTDQYSSADRSTLLSLQQSMLEEAKSCFSANTLEDLRVVIRLVFEFNRVLIAGDVDNDAADSVFSGISCFSGFIHLYGVLEWAETQSRLSWAATTPASLKREFLRLYPQFVTERIFEKKCRILLDLYKLELALAAITYDCDID